MFIDAQRVLANHSADGIKTAQAEMAEIVAAHDAPEAVREQASVLNVRLLLGSKPSAAALEKAVVDHIKAFPKSKVNRAMAKMLVGSLAAGQDEEHAIASLEELKKSPLAEIAAAATTRLAQLEALANLKKEPMELKFRAADGRQVDLEKLRGKIVLVDFWATWCGPCVAGMPEVIELYNKYHDHGLEIVAISFDEDKSALADFVKEHQMAWPQYFDGKAWDNDYGQKYGIQSIPTMWLVGKDGQVIDFHARDGLADKLSKLLSSDEHTSDN